MALYRQGKAAMDANGIVTGTGTNWQSALTLIRPGATILFLSSPIQMAVVNKVVSDTQINAISTNGAAVPSSDYAILLSDSLTVDGLAQDVAETLRYYQSQETVIAEAVDFFKDFDLSTLQELVEQAKEEAAASQQSASASQQSASASQQSASASQQAAAASQQAAAASQQAADDAEATRDEIQQIIDDSGEQSTLVVLAQPNGAKNIGRCSDIATLRTIEPTLPNQKIEVIKYASGYKPITGYFEYDQTDSTSVDDGGVCIVTAGGKRWKRIFDGAVNVAWFGIPSDGDITNAINKAISYAKPKRLGLVISAGQYKYTGSEMLEIDLGFISLVCHVGCASIDFSGVTSTYAINVYSSATYPAPLYRNTVNKLSGIECFGAKVAGKNGLLIGRPGGAQYYNGQCCIEHCSFHDFDYVVSCANSTWRYKFNECVITKGITSIFYAPAGLLDSGESITFNGGMVADASGAPIIIACDAFNLGLDGTSTLNTRVQITGNGATVSMSGMGNIENPGQSVWYPYVTCTGTGARFILSESTLTINQPLAQTQPIIYVGINAFIIFNVVKFPGNPYKFEQNSSDMVRAFVEGPGSVMCNACTSDIASGAGNIPVHRSLSPVYNSGFEQGNNTGWSINNAGSASQTAVVSAEYAKAGSYGMRMTSIAGLSIFATQQFNVKPGQYYMTSFWARVVNIGANGNAAGNINLSFYSQNGTQIAGPTANLPVNVADWAVYGSFIRGIVPPGAATAVISMRAYDGAVVDFDGVLINFI
nr:tail spike protein [Klebsiella phage vB_Kpn_K2PH164C2]